MQGALTRACAFLRELRSRIRFRLTARRKTEVSLRFKAYDGTAASDSVQVSVGRRGPLYVLNRLSRRYMTMSRALAGVIVVAALLGVWRAYDAGWISGDNPLVGVMVWARNGLILDFSSPVVWGIIVFWPLIWRAAPEGWRLVLFPFVGNLMFLQLSHWTMIIVTSGLSSFSGGIAAVLQSLTGALR